MVSPLSSSGDPQGERQVSDPSLPKEKDSPPLQIWAWTEEEDTILLEHVKQHGTRKWKELVDSGRLHYRSTKACCNRFRRLREAHLESTIGVPHLAGILPQVSSAPLPPSTHAHSSAYLEAMRRQHSGDPASTKSVVSSLAPDSTLADLDTLMFSRRIPQAQTAAWPLQQPCPPAPHTAPAAAASFPSLRQLWESPALGGLRVGRGGGEGGATGQWGRLESMENADGDQLAQYARRLRTAVAQEQRLASSEASSGLLSSVSVELGRAEGRDLMAAALEELSWGAEQRTAGSGGGVGRERQGQGGSLLAQLMQMQQRQNEHPDRSQDELATLAAWGLSNPGSVTKQFASNSKVNSWQLPSSRQLADSQAAMLASASTKYMPEPRDLGKGRLCNSSFEPYGGHRTYSLAQGLEDALVSRSDALDEVGGEAYSAAASQQLLLSKRKFLTEGAHCAGQGNWIGQRMEDDASAAFLREGSAPGVGRGKPALPMSFPPQHSLHPLSRMQALLKGKSAEVSSSSTPEGMLERGGGVVEEGDLRYRQGGREGKRRRWGSLDFETDGATRSDAQRFGGASSSFNELIRFPVTELPGGAHTNAVVLD